MGGASWVRVPAVALKGREHTMQVIVAIPGAGVRAIKSNLDAGAIAIESLLDGPAMRCLTPYSRSHSIYLWVNEEAKEELMTRNFEVNEQFASNPLYGTIVFTSWDGVNPQALSKDQVAFVLEKLAH